MAELEPRISLNAALDNVHTALRAYVHRLRAAEPAEPAEPAAPSGPPLADDGHPPLAHLCARFGLSPFERDLLLLCAGVELDPAIAALCAEAQGASAYAAPTLALALAALADPHWDALTPVAPLRRWRLIELGPSDSLVSGPLRIDERVLHFLAGVSYLDERLAGLLSLMPPAVTPPASQQALATRVAAALRGAPPAQALPIIQLDGDQLGRQVVALAACAELGLTLYRLSAAALPSESGALDGLARLIERETALGGLALLVDSSGLDLADTQRSAALASLIERLAAPLFLAEPLRRPPQRPVYHIDVARPTADEQRAAWHHALAPHAAAAPQLIDQLVTQFSLDGPTIAAVAAEAALGRNDTGEMADAIWASCRRAARPQLDDLAQRIMAGAAWEDLVIPEAQRQILQDIAAHVRQRATVYERWGMAGRVGRGLGISALFAGASGTGKTTAAEVLADTLRLDLYRIDLSAVVSKYIGETEKNLRRVFDAAEIGGAILLFDEADALFGKRSEVKDSHDRHANIEVSYLLQRMESYRGLAILTTNMRAALDPAFLRRIRFVVQFPFPDAAQRAELWRRAFPPSTPTAGLNVERLARLTIAGGNIRNIALNAAFLAADEGQPVGMAQLLRAARAEYAKLERTLTEAEIAGWA
jgi:ATPase family associated with various cellular activities (AAA)